MTPELMSTVVADPALPRSAVRILFVIHQELPEGEWRPVKLVWVTRRSGLSRQAVITALRRLVEHGYLERAPTCVGAAQQAHRYRLGRGRHASN